MTARGDAVVATGGEAPVTRVFRPGDIVRAEGYDHRTDGEVIPPPADAAVHDPDGGLVWVNVRQMGPLPFDPADLHVLDVTRAIAGTLDLLARVGIKVARHEVGIRPEVAALICDDDEPGEHDGHARSVVLWFESMDDVEALSELTYFGPFEFGCSWPSVYGGDGIRAMVEDGPVIRAVHLADLPTLADLARRELAGEFGGDARSIRDRWLYRSGRQVAMVVVAVQMFLALVLHRTPGLASWVSLVAFGAVLAFDLYRVARYGRPVPRTHLDAARRRSRQVVRGSGPR